MTKEMQWCRRGNSSLTHFKRPMPNVSTYHHSLRTYFLQHKENFEEVAVLSKLERITDSVNKIQLWIECIFINHTTQRMWRNTIETHRRWAQCGPRERTFQLANSVREQPCKPDPQMFSCVIANPKRPPVLWGVTQSGNNNFSMPLKVDPYSNMLHLESANDPFFVCESPFLLTDSYI